MRVELSHVYKSFGNVQANHDVSMTVEAGTVYGILGENGAGKSTLSKMLSGFITKDSGKILLNGIEVNIQTPADAICAGVGMLHQDPLDFPSLSVLDNFMAGRSALAKSKINKTNSKTKKTTGRDALAKELQHLSAIFGFDLHPSDRLANLTVGERQQLEILRLLSLGVQTLILDEPTTGISASQKTALFTAVKQLAAEGKSIIFVSHKLEDVEELCDRLMVMRQGKVIGEAEVKVNGRGRESAELASSLVEMMFGRELAIPAKHGISLDHQEPALVIDDLLVEGDRLSLQIDKLTVKAGEVIGLAGLEGNGQQLLLLACAGLLKPKSGTIRINGTDMTNRAYNYFRKAGIGYLPADRLQDGLIRGLSIHEHFMLRQSSSGFFINWSDTRKFAQEAIDTFNIRGKTLTKVEKLSGGNQQRTQIALLPEYLSLLLMEQPTRGLDIESTLWIWKQMMERCEKGMMIFFISSDLDEILQYSDRLLVFSGGKVSQPMDAKTLTVDKLGQAIGGKFA